MSVSPVTTAPAIQPEPQTPVNKAAVSHPSTPPQPAYTVSLSSAAQKAATVDVDHDGDKH